MTGLLTWWGHSTSTWQDGDTTVLFDPVLTARLGHLRRVRGPVPPSRAAHADIILISHLHADHTHLPSLRLIPASAVLVAPAGSRRLLEPITARGLKLREVKPGDLVKLGGLQIRVLAADHDGRRHPWSPHRGPALGYLVAGSFRCWYPGDTGPHLAYEEVAHVDIALMPVGGWGPTPWSGPSRRPASRRGGAPYSPRSCRPRALGNLVAYRPPPARRSHRSAGRGLRRPRRSPRTNHQRASPQTRPVGQAVAAAAKMGAPVGPTPASFDGASVGRPGRRGLPFGSSRGQKPARPQIRVTPADRTRSPGPDHWGQIVGDCQKPRLVRGSKLIEANWSFRESPMVLSAPRTGPKSYERRPVFRRLR